MNSPNEMMLQIQAIKQQNEPLGIALLSALKNVESEPKKAMLECRFILETILAHLIDNNQTWGLSRVVNAILSRQYSGAAIPPRLVPRMAFIWSMASIASSSEKVEIDDVYSILENLLYVAEWFVSNIPPEDFGQNDGSQSLEILPQLKAQYKDYLEPGIISVIFRQTEYACYIQVATEIDLRFIVGQTSLDDGSGALFKPQKSIYENVKTFLHDLDEVTIANCLPLFHAIAVKRLHEEAEKARLADDTVPEEDIPM